MSDDLWPCRPLPQEGESLFSWFTRLAHKNGLTPLELQRWVLEGSIPALRDLDRTACDALVANLVQHTGVTEEYIRSISFHRWIGRMQTKDDGRGILPWLLPILRGETRRILGHPYCPQCLAEDKVPYMRLTWRLSFATICPQHKTLLLDHCPHCRTPISIQTLAPSTPLDICVQCGRSISAISPPEPQEWATLALSAQQGFLRAAEGAEVLLGRYGPVATPDFFFIVLRLLQVLSARRVALPLRNHVAKALDWDIPPSSIPRLRLLHLLNPRSRAILSAMSWWLIQNWPQRFTDACQSAGIHVDDLLRRRQPAPFAFEEPIRRYLTGSPGGSAHPPDDDAKSRTERTYSVAWGHHRFWKLDGISPDVRAAAKVAAHLEGENVGAWVNHVLREKLANELLL